MDKQRDDIEKYLAGKLTHAEMHALEKKALNDPFLAEALEGAELIDAADYSRDLLELNEKLTKRKGITWTWPLRIAATVALLAISMVVIWVALKQDTNDTLALQPRVSKEDPITTPAPKIQTPPAPATQQSPAPDTASRSAQPKKEIQSTPRPKRQKPSGTPQIAANKQAEELPALSEKPATPENAKDIVSSPVTAVAAEEQTKNTANDPEKKNEVQLPSASEIKIAEGFIEAVDARPTLVTGRVLSAEDGTPLPDVSVALKGTAIMTKTDAHGRYSITANSRQKTLIYSSEGLESTEVKIDGIDSTYLPVKIEMTDAAQEEAAVETSGMRDFGPTNVYTIPAHPETGNRAFKQYLEKNHKYPREARDQNVEGTVIIEFKVDATGALSEFRIVRGIGNGCDEEVIRLILQGAKWVPTTKDGTPVNDKARVKFKFELEE